MKVPLLSPAACKNDSCHYGDCVETINSHKCACFEGFYGEKCEQGKEIHRCCARVKFTLLQDLIINVSCFLCWQLLSATKRR